MEDAVEIRAAGIKAAVVDQSPRIQARKEEERQRVETIHVRLGPGDEPLGRSGFVAMDRRGNVEAARHAQATRPKIKDVAAVSSRELLQPESRGSGDVSPPLDQVC